MITLLILIYAIWLNIIKSDSNGFISIRPLLCVHQAQDMEELVYNNVYTPLII